jgi:hypothetical protein
MVLSFMTLKLGRYCLSFQGIERRVTFEHQG